MDQISNVTDLELLDQLEAEIEAAERDAYLVRGRALGQIRNGDRLWRVRHNVATFEEYCEQRWEMDRSRAYRLIGAATFAKLLVARGQQKVPSSERHIRPLLERLEDDDDRIAVWRDVLATAGGNKIKAADVDNAISRFLALRNKEYVTLDEWREMKETDRATVLGRAGSGGLNKQKEKEDGADIEWADWSWNPVTGCLHGCPYCYAREIAFSIYPADVRFSPTIWLDRLTAPQNQKVPKDADKQIARKNIFTCSMADLFGRWVPTEWIERVLAEVSVNPQWNFLFLTKFPKRMSEFLIPENAWMGTTVDLQARVANAEKAFEAVNAAVRWLSIEPMIQPLKFNRLDLFDWIVIGGASPSKAVDGFPATPEWNIPIEWIADLHQQARAAGCKVYYKNNSGLFGLTRLREYPGHDAAPVSNAPDVFHYLGNIPKKEQVG
jgi:protein gp37